MLGRFELDLRPKHYASKRLEAKVSKQVFDTVTEASDNRRSWNPHNLAMDKLRDLSKRTKSIKLTRLTYRFPDAMLSGFKSPFFKDAKKSSTGAAA